MNVEEYNSHHSNGETVNVEEYDSHHSNGERQ